MGRRGTVSLATALTFLSLPQPPPCLQTQSPSLPADGGFTPSLKVSVGALLATLQPHAVAFNGGGLARSPTRWIGSESGYAPIETWSTCALDSSGAGSPLASTWYPPEVDFTVLQHDTWFWDSAQAVRPPAELRAMYEGSVGRNSQALIGLGIPPNGTLAGTAQAAALAGLGAYVTGCYGSPVASTSGPGPLLSVMPSSPVAIDRVSASEDQSTGQLVRSWVLTALLPDGTQQQLAAGESIGNKRIVVLEAPVTVSMVTLNVTSAAGPSVIRELSIFGGCGALAQRLG